MVKQQYKIRTILFFSFLFLLLFSCQENFLPSEEQELFFSFGGQGTKQGQFIKPRAIVISPQNEIYAVDMTGRIQAFDIYGKYLHSFRTPEIALGKPTGLGFSSHGILWVADTHYHRVLSYSKEGKLLFQFGEYGKKLDEFIYPTDVAIDREGFLYITQYGDALGEYDRIQKFTAKGQFIMAWGKRGTKPGEFERPMSIVVEKKQTILVADACNHRIQRFSTKGKFLFSWGTPGKKKGQLSYPYGIALDSKGNIYVSEFGNNRIQKFTPKGKSLGYFGQPGRSIGKFANPWDIAIGKKGNIYVADALNHRIQKIPKEIFASE